MKTIRESSQNFTDSWCYSHTRLYSNFSWYLRFKTHLPSSPTYNATQPVVFIEKFTFWKPVWCTMALKICMHAFIFVSKAAKSWSMNFKFPCLSKRKKISIAFCLEHALSLSIKLYWKHVWNIRVPPYNEANLGWQKHKTVMRPVFLTERAQHNFIS